MRPGRASINCYLVEVPDFTAAALGGADAKRFKIDPQRLLYSLQWKHNCTPPDFHLSLVQDLPEQWVSAADLVLLGELRRRAPEAIDWAGLTEAGVVAELDAFEAAQEAAPRRH
jgi:hypothetical protein